MRPSRGKRGAVVTDSKSVLLTAHGKLLHTRYTFLSEKATRQREYV